MPLYEYICSSCDHKFELLRPMSLADAGVSCPRCHNSVRRVPSVFACFSRSAEGISMPVAGTGPSCAGCGASSCDSCH